MISIPPRKYNPLALILILLILCAGPLQAQYYSTGSDPASIRWKQTRVRGFNLIYPSTQQDLAIKYRNILSDIADPVAASMQSHIRNLPMILHPFTSFSNGISTLAPRRIEYYPKQPIALETNDFSSQLIIHEVRHFAQMDRLNTGFTKAAGYVLGEQAQSLVLGLHVPTWLLEGDAVLTETLLSHGGRGRMAGFIQPLRSRLIDNRDLSWDRVSFGSYKDVLPNEYLFGYFLTARGRMLADPLLWSDALAEIGRNPFQLKGLSGITWPKTGFRFSKLYVETLEWLRDFWTDPSLSVKSPDHLQLLTMDSTEYQNYFRPQPYSDYEVICLKRELGDISAFVIIDTSGSERIIARPGTIEDAGFSYRDGRLVWSELIRDTRWENRSWSDLFVFDLATWRKIRLTHGQRYFSPAFSPGGDRLAVINERDDGTSFLEILDPLDGSVIGSMPEVRGDHYSYFCWGSGSDELYAITTGHGGRKLIRLDFKTMSQNVMVDAGFSDISCPAASGDWIYFAGPAGATLGLHRVNRNTKVRELVFGHPHGINYLNAHDGELFLSVYSSNGYRPAKISMSSLHGKATRRIEPLVEPVTEIIQRADGEFPVVYDEAEKTIATEDYRKGRHLFRLHSWSPLFINPDSYQINPGVVFMSQNDLSTLTSWTGYQYSKTDRSHNLLASARYSGLYPAFQADYARKYRNFSPTADTAPVRSGGFPAAYRQFLRFSAGLPLNFSSGAWNRNAEPSIFFEQVSYLADRQSETNHSAWMAGISLSADLLRKMSYRDLFPRWGLSMDFSYFKAFGRTGSGNNGTGRVILFLPGLLPNSSLRILNSASTLAFDQFLTSMQDFPRGQVVYQVRNSYNLKVDYAFPVSYPDYHLSWLIYIKRVKANLFFDAGTALYQRNWFTSTGLDLTFDYYLFRVGIALESGVRMMYFPATRKPGAEFLFSFSVN